MALETSESKNLYELLGVQEDASDEQIRQVYREIARVYHPDSNFYSEIIEKSAAEEQSDFFKIITAAYNTLTDPALRAQYDEKLKAIKINLRGWEDGNEDFWSDSDRRWKNEVTQTRPRARTTTGVFGRRDIDEAIENAEEEQVLEEEASAEALERDQWRRKLIIIGLSIGVLGGLVIGLLLIRG